MLLHLVVTVIMVSLREEEIQIILAMSKDSREEMIEATAQDEEIQKLKEIILSG